MTTPTPSAHSGEQGKPSAAALAPHWKNLDSVAGLLERAGQRNAAGMVDDAVKAIRRELERSAAKAVERDSCKSYEWSDDMFETWWNKDPTFPYIPEHYERRVAYLRPQPSASEAPGVEAMNAVMDEVESLRVHAKVADDARYGALSTTFVRQHLDRIDAAIAAQRNTRSTTQSPPEAGSVGVLQEWELLSMKFLAEALRKRGDDLSADAASWLEKFSAAPAPKESP